MMLVDVLATSAFILSNFIISSRCTYSFASTVLSCMHGHKIDHVSLNLDIVLRSI